PTELEPWFIPGSQTSVIDEKDEQKEVGSESIQLPSQFPPQQTTTTSSGLESRLRMRGTEFQMPIQVLEEINKPIPTPSSSLPTPPVRQSSRTSTQTSSKALKSIQQQRQQLLQPVFPSAKILAALPLYTSSPEPINHK